MEKRQGNIKVFSRFRPFNSKENAANPCKLHRIANNKQLIIKEQKQEKQEEMSFLYDYVFDVDSTQQQVFEQVGYPVLNNIIEGYNGTIMAYGQTSSGKTHTMQGYDLNDKENKGIMPRIVHSFLSRQTNFSMLSTNLLIPFSLNSKSQSSKYIWKKSEISQMSPKMT